MPRRGTLEFDVRFNLYLNVMVRVHGLDELDAESRVANPRITIKVAQGNRINISHRVFYKAHAVPARPFQSDCLWGTSTKIQHLSYIPDWH